MSTAGSDRIDIVMRSLQQDPQVLFWGLCWNFRHVLYSPYCLKIRNGPNQSECPFVAVSGPHWRTAAADHTWQHKPVRQAPVTGAKCVFFPRHVLQTISLKVRFIARLFFPFCLSLSLSPTFCFLFLVPSSLSQEFIQLLSDSAFCLCMVSLTVFCPSSPPM